MNPRKKTISAALAGAVVLASGAYAIGNEQDDGSARAARQSSPTKISQDRGPRLGLDRLASRLGVSESKLRSALRELHGERRRGEHGPGELASQLSAALGVSEARVKSALGALRERGDRQRERARADFTQRLAKELGVSEAKVRSAFPGPAGGRGSGSRRLPPRRSFDPLADAAKTLGLGESKLRTALEKVRPDHRLGERRDGRMRDDLARRLGVSSASLEKALERVRARHERRARTRRDAFAERLANKLGISVEKVGAALADGGPRGLRRGPGGPYGPGGPLGIGGPGGHGASGGHGGPGGPGGPPPGRGF